MNYAPDQAAQAESGNKLLGDQIYPVFNVDGLWFYIENDRAVLCRHTMGERGLAMEQYRGEPELTIPSQIEHEGKTYPVTKIGEMAFGTLWQTEGLKRIAIPSSVTEIGFSAFNSLIGLESIYT